MNSSPSNSKSDKNQNTTNTQHSNKKYSAHTTNTLPAIPPKSGITNSLVHKLDDAKFRDQIGANKPGGVLYRFGRGSVHLKPGRSAMESTFRL